MPDGVFVLSALSRGRSDGPHVLRIRSLRAAALGELNPLSFAKIVELQEFFAREVAEAASLRVCARGMVLYRIVI